MAADDYLKADRFHGALVLSVYLPSLLMALVQGMVILLIPLYALESGASLLGAGALFAVRNAGTLVANIPVGLALARFGDKALMLAGMMLAALSCFSLAQWQTMVGLILSMFMFGAGIGTWMLARLSFMTASSVAGQRGRSFALLAGVQRTGTFAGPLLGGLLAQFYSFEFAFMVAVVCIATASLLIISRHFITNGQVAVSTTSGQLAHLFLIIKKYRRLFLNVGTVVAALRLVRGARQLLLPLWGHALGLEYSAIGLVFTLSLLADVVLMYPGGMIADHLGRKWSAGLCLGIVSCSLIFLPLSDSYWEFLWLALLGGLGNGLGGGIIMTLGADLAPAHNRGMFLSVWRMLSDVTGTVSPLVIGWLAGLFTLGAASVISGVLGILGMVVMIFRVRDTLPSSSPATRGHASKRK